MYKSLLMLTHRVFMEAELDDYDRDKFYDLVVLAAQQMAIDTNKKYVEVVKLAARVREGQQLRKEDRDKLYDLVMDMVH